MEDLNNKIFELITFSGTAKSMVYEALGVAKENKEEAFALLKEADNLLKQAHQVQSNFLGDMLDEKVSLLMVHAQDHMMHASEVRNLAEAIINLI